MGRLFAVAVACCLCTAAHAETGIASIYHYEGGRRTANNERVNPAGLTAAHKTLPFNTVVKVTNRRNGRSVLVRINDRGPFRKGRIIDLTPAGARVLGFSDAGAGLAPVNVEIVVR
jgi:rare lipoprotein A